MKKKYFELVRLGAKNFKIRQNDRDFKLGDTFTLMEIDDSGEATCVMIGPVLIKHIAYGGVFGLYDGYVILGFDKGVVVSNFETFEKLKTLKRVLKETGNE